MADTADHLEVMTVNNMVESVRFYLSSDRSGSTTTGSFDDECESVDKDAGVVH